MIKNNYDIAEWILIKQAQSDGITKQQIDIWNLYLDEKDDLNRSMKSCTMQELNTCYMYYGKLRQKFWIPSGRYANYKGIHGL